MDLGANLGSFLEVLVLRLLHCGDLDDAPLGYVLVDLFDLFFLFSMVSLLFFQMLRNP